MPIFYQVAGKFQISNVVLREVLYLHQSASPAPRPICTIELEESMASAITAHGARNGLVLLHRGLCHEQAKLEDFQHFSICIGNHGFDSLLIQTVYFHTAVAEPPFDLCRGIGVFQPGQFIGPGGDGFFVLLIAENGVCHQFLIDQNATVIDFLIHLVQAHLAFGNRIVPQLLANLTLCIHISDTVGFEACPFLRLIGRKISGSTAVGLGGLARHGEESHQICAFFQLFPFDVQHLTDSVQGEGESQHSGLNRRTLPGNRG